MAMPGMDGRAAMDILRKDPELAAIPILVVTGQGNVADIRAEAVLEKPLQPDRLLATIERLLGRKNGS